MMTTTRRIGFAATTTLLASMLIWSAPAAAQLKSAEHPEANPVWKKVRAGLFEGRSIVMASDDMLTIDAPVRAEDAAIVPISIKTRMPAGSKLTIDKLWLVIDANPSPISAVIDFAPSSGRADIETRVRINDYTHVRAVAETSDGRLHMATRYVKAAGGCSAPPAKAAGEALAALGKIKLRVDGDPSGERPVLANLMISHPNDSGFYMDPQSKNFTPAHYVRTINVSYAGKPVMSADVDFSISENPNLRFYFLPQGKDGELRAEIVDSNELKFESALKVSAAARQ